MPSRNLTGPEARAFLAKADLRGLRTRAGISAVTMATALDADQSTLRNWEARRGFPRGWTLIGYARVIAGLARHETVTIPADDEEAGRAA